MAVSLLIFAALLALAWFLVLGADITITAASVVADSGFTYQDVTAGATITAGQPVYLDSTDSNSAKLADANASLATSRAIGLAAHAALDGQPLRVITGGNVTLGASPLTVGTIYVVSATAGGIAPAADLTTGHYVTILGVASTTAKLNLSLKATGIVV